MSEEEFDLFYKKSLNLYNSYLFQALTFRLKGVKYDFFIFFRKDFNQCCLPYEYS
jgi:hypothetical protein